MSDTRKHLFNLDGTHNSSACWCEPVKPHTYTESEVREMVAEEVERCAEHIERNPHSVLYRRVFMQRAADIRSGKEDL